MLKLKFPQEARLMMNPCMKYTRTQLQKRNKQPAGELQTFWKKRGRKRKNRRVVKRQKSAHGVTVNLNLTTNCSATESTLSSMTINNLSTTIAQLSTSVNQLSTNLENSNKQKSAPSHKEPKKEQD